MQQQSVDEPIRVLVIAAHPDDPEFACGGTSARWAAEGKEVYYLVCTRGDRGSSDPEMTSERLVQIRQGEQRAAARVIGAKEVNFLNFTDGELAPTYEFREAIVREIRRVRPDCVMTHDPTSVYTAGSLNHPDHRAVGTATLDSVYPTARDRLNYPEHEQTGLLPHKVKEVYLWGAPNPNVWVDISSTFETKIESLRCHVSQVGKAEQLAERLRERAQKVGEPQGIPLAEAFFKVAMAR
ncbi:MAG TPA: PIG-L deacetylase family protein [Chloroflexota bacterium]|nr:PIG-L deacetylase family protein [Chloroflexota bacterium]HUX87355.1 PIG-L deacetylase family protein [Chloroflexota bacterium]HVB97345.1 PIG-L deacetylase family protein [Chloroflexota bacterium]